MKLTPFRISIAILAFLSTAKLFAVDQAALVLTDVLDSLGVEMSWNMLLDQAVFSRDADFLVVTSGQNWAVKNGNERVPFPSESISLRNGTLTKAGVDSLAKIFPLPSAPSSDVRRLTTIFIDPGHGGKDPGSRGSQIVNGKSVILDEKSVTLNTALVVRDLLKAKYPDKKIVISRDTDIYLPLEERAKLANKYALSRDQHTIFISIHANASINPKAKGYEVWYLPPEYRRQLLQEGDFDVVDKSLSPILNDLIEEEYTQESQLLGQSILKSLDSNTGGVSVNRGLKAETWYVVRSARMPSILVEVGFVTNPDEFSLLRSDSYIKTIGAGIVDGVVNFVSSYEYATPK